MEEFNVDSLSVTRVWGLVVCLIFVCKVSCLFAVSLVGVLDFRIGEFFDFLEVFFGFLRLP